LHVRVLITGDTHIPDRAERVNPVVEAGLRLFGSFDYVLFTGDLTSRGIMDWLSKLGGRIYIVRGNMDYLPLPRKHVIEVEGWTIGLIHGDSVHPRGDPTGLTRLAQELGVSILVTGHTHEAFIKPGVRRDILLVNPGSLTGVWSGGGGSLIPSFMVSWISSDGLLINLYTLRGGVLTHESYFAELKNSSWIITRMEAQ